MSGFAGEIAVAYNRDAGRNQHAMVAQSRPINGRSRCLLIGFQRASIVRHWLHHAAHREPRNIFQRIAQMGKFPIDQRGQLIMIEQKIAGAGIAMHQNDRTIRVRHRGLQPVKGKVEQGIWLAHLVIHGPPDGNIAFDMIHDTAMATAIEIDVARINPVQRGKIGHERGGNRLFCRSILQMAEFRDPAHALCQNGARSFAACDEARRQHGDGRDRTVDIGFTFDRVRFGARHLCPRIMAQKVFMDLPVRSPHINRPRLPPVAA